MSPSQTPVRPVRWYNLVAYGTGDLFGGGSFVLVSLLFLFFLTDVIGLPPGAAGLVVMLGKIWDALFDPVMGYLTDHTRSRFGRRRVYFLFGCVPVALAFASLWLPVRLGEPLAGAALYATFAYFVLAYVVFSTVFTMVMVPYSAINAEMSQDNATRTRLTAARMIGSGTGTMLAGVLPKLVVSQFEDPKVGFVVMGIAFGLFFAAPWPFVFAGTFEATAPATARPLAGTTHKAPLADFFGGLVSLAVNRSFRVHIAMYVAAYSAFDIMLAVALYYVTHYLHRAASFPLFLGALLCAQLVSIGVYVVIANRFGKGPAFILGLSVWALAMVLSFMLPSEAPSTWVAAMFVFAGLGTSAGAMIPWAILPSVTDIDELITGQQRAGTYAGAMIFIRKLVQAGVLFALGLVLQAVGYTPGATQSPTTVQGLRVVFCLLPLVFIALGIGAALFFKVTPRTHALLTDELARLRQGGSKTDVAPKTRSACEVLTGLPYERLYAQRR
jgi:oligogalacturonide transporter